MLQIEELKQELLVQQPKIEYLKEALGLSEAAGTVKNNWMNRQRSRISGMM